jgi:hypothetical protein
MNKLLYVIGGYNRSGQYNSVHIFNLGKEIPFNEKDFHWNERHEGNPRLAYYQNEYFIYLCSLFEYFSWRKQTEHVEKDYCGCSPMREGSYFPSPMFTPIFRV